MGDPFVESFAAAVGLRLGAGLRAQLVAEPDELRRGEAVEPGAERLVVGGDLGAVALGRRGDVGEALAAGRVRRVLLALEVDLRGRVEEGLLPAPRGRDVQLLPIHRRIGHDVGAVYRRALRLVGGGGVGVLERRRPVARVLAAQVVGVDHTRLSVSTPTSSTPPVGVDRLDPPALAVVDAGAVVVDAGDDLVADREAGLADLDLKLAEPTFAPHHLTGQRIQPPDLGVSLRDHQRVLALGEASATSRATISSRRVSGSAETTTRSAER